MIFLKNLREFFWPLLEPIKKFDFTPLNVIDLTVEDQDLDTCYEMTLRYYDSENERKKTVESKSTIFIAATGFAITILLSMASGLLLNPKNNSNIFTSFSIFMWIIIVIYFCRTVWYSICALERREYHTIGPNDYIAKKPYYRKKLIVDIINKTKKNSYMINLKVDNMVMAQEYFKRGIAAIAIYSLMAGCYGLSIMTSWDIFLKENWFPLVNAASLIINIIIFVLLR